MWPQNKNKCLSPRQIANKAYTLAIKKLDRDDKRKKPQYSVRERLLLSNTMAKAEDVLNKKIRVKNNILSDETIKEESTPVLRRSEQTPIKEQIKQQPDESLLAVSMVAVAAVVVYSSIQQSNNNMDNILIQYNDCRPKITPHAAAVTTMI